MSKGVKKEDSLQEPSRRDETLAKVDEILSDDFTIFDLKRGAASAESPEPLNPMDPDALVEAAQAEVLGETAKSAEAKTKPAADSEGTGAKAAPQDSCAACPQQAAPSDPVREPASKTGRGFWNHLVQFFIIIFVLGWVFLLGVLVGRGNIWHSTMGHEFLTWVEKKAGWDPEVLLVPSIIPQVVLEEREEDLLILDDQVALDSSSVIPVPDITSSLQQIQRPEPPPDIAASSENLPNAFQSQRELDESVSISASTPPEGRGRFTVQAAYASTETEAKDQVKNLKDLDFDAYYYQNEKGRFPVRVGRFDTFKEADQTRQRLDVLGYRGPYVSKLQGQD